MMISSTAPTRPVLRWHGGKYRLRAWALSFFPPHRLYTEAYGGAASVLMAKPRTYAEVYNDLDTEVVNVFRVLRDPVAARELERLLRLTPFSRDEFERAWEPSDDPTERARRTVLKSFAGFGANAAGGARPCGMRTRASSWPTTGIRSSAKRSGSTPATDWARYPSVISSFTDRLQGVVIENRPALDVIRQHDTADALHFVDPPYVHSERGKNFYRHELSDDGHRELVDTLRTLEGAVVLCGYPSAFYGEMLAGWERHERTAYADGARKRTECVWLNAACLSRLRRTGLFASQTGAADA